MIIQEHALWSLALLVVASLAVAVKAKDFDNERLRVAVQEYLDNPTAAKAKYGPMEDWSTWRVTDMSRLFQGATNFSADLDKWDVSQVSTMHHIFAGCQSFDGSLQQWNVGQVTDFSFAFWGATSFKGTDIGTWDVSFAETMEQMFLGATSFVGPPDLDTAWDVSSVTNMHAMFYGATSFNRSLNGWNVAKVQQLNSMFEGATSFNQQVCWERMHPMAQCYQCFCHTNGAGFAPYGEEEECPQMVHPSILAYSQACEANDVLEEMIESQNFGRPDLGLHDEQFMGGLGATGTFSKGSSLTSPINNVAVEEQSSDGGHDMVVTSGLQRETSSAGSNSVKTSSHGVGMSALGLVVLAITNFGPSLM